LTFFVFLFKILSFCCLIPEKNGFYLARFEQIFAYCIFGMQFAFNWAGVASKG